MNTFIINTNRLVIRPLILSDLVDFHRYRSNPEVTKYQGFDVFNLQQASDFILMNSTKDLDISGTWVQYGIENLFNQQLIGDCAIKLDGYENTIAEIGITISHLEQQKGYATEAMNGIIDFLFKTKNIRRIVEIVDVENMGSIRLLEKIGFKREGHFVENIFFKGKWGSEFQYALLKKEWEEKNLKTIH